MKPIFKTLIGQRVKNKLIQHAYDQNYQGTRQDLLKSIHNCENIITITCESIADVIQGEIEVLSSREDLDQGGNTLILFLAGLVHAREMITDDKSLIGKVELE